MTEEEQERERFDAERYFEGTEVAYLARASKWMHDHAEGYRTDMHCAESLVEEFLQVEKEVTLRWLAPMECGHATCFQQLKPSDDGSSVEKICLVCHGAAPKSAPHTVTAAKDMSSQALEAGALAEAKPALSAEPVPIRCPFCSHDFDLSENALPHAAERKP